MKHLLIDARKEILSLRQDNAVLAAQVHVVNVFAAVLGFKSSGHQGMGIDVAWQLQELIDDLQAKEDRQKKRDSKAAPASEQAGN